MNKFTSKLRKENYTTSTYVFGKLQVFTRETHWRHESLQFRLHGRGQHATSPKEGDLRLVPGARAVLPLGVAGQVHQVVVVKVQDRKCNWT